jgi:hypothetical protein
MNLGIKKNWNNIRESLIDLSRFKTYNKIVAELLNVGKLDEIGLKADDDLNMYVGINLNPEMLIYADTSKESAELRFVGEKLGKYTDFLTKEGILDYIKVDYDRVKTEEYYGYILKMSYNFKVYSRKKFVYSICYLSALSLTVVSGLSALIAWLVYLL